MGNNIIDSNIIIYSASPENVFLRNYFNDTENNIASISIIEVLGYSKLTPKDKKYFEAVFNVVNIIHLSTSIIEEAVYIRKSLSISLGDSIIAATAITNNLTLVTRNTADFKNIKNLSLYNPFDK